MRVPRQGCAPRGAGLTLTSAEQGTRQRRVWPWKSGGTPTSTSQRSGGMSPGGLDAPGSAEGTASYLAGWRQRLDAGQLPALLGTDQHRPLSLSPLPSPAPFPSPSPDHPSAGPCHGHPEVLSVLLPPWPGVIIAHLGYSRWTEGRHLLVKGSNAHSLNRDSLNVSSRY